MTEETKTNKTMLIVAINLIVLAAYTVYMRSSSRGLENSIGMAVFIILHCAICLIVAAFWYRRAFLLSAAAVLLIGFSTCYFINS
jgi:hypothetical protein